MVLIEDRIRDILIYCKENIDYKTLADGSFSIRPVSLKELLDSKLQYKYEQKDIMYSVLKLEEIGFIKISNRTPRDQHCYINDCNINELTYSAHKFLGAIESDTVWSRTKNTISKVGNHTLGFIETVAHDVAVESAKEFIKIGTGQ